MTMTIEHRHQAVRCAVCKRGIRPGERVLRSRRGDGAVHAHLCFPPRGESASGAATAGVR